ncbi:MAG: ribosome small subunit-dependent GTPase A [Erysipelothrix sp.]|nr:ribosome small subunit-dependent GTPase A [Erysipelothrix sp.]
MVKKARIIKNISNQYTVYFDNETHIATAMGKLRLGKRPTVGDFVEIEFLENKWVIQKVLERKNELIRPLIANVDQALIVMSLREPDFSYRLVDRLIFLVAIENIEPIIVVNKVDLDSDGFLEEVVSSYEPYGYKVITTQKGDDTENITTLLKDKLTVLAGQSGVGKSSIINRIDARYQLQTQEISKVLGRGKHTTRHNELYLIGGGWIADTPGFSSLDFKHVDPLDLAHRIPDFNPYHESCKFRNCLHQSEPGCVVKKALEEGKISARRYAHYLECINIIKEEAHG